MDQILPLDCAAWLEQVNAVLKRDWCIDSADAGWSPEDVLRYWRFGEAPEVFVAWFAEKYDLIRFEPHE
ncbi:hypothetical protein [Brevundimonas sp. M20]|uniref:hypothetical protein n=1 Tax=Brevundimonas sp. M20 TaxID=2591463 RepID=UPI0011466779|nr:hypothetical protein [Brevundimonas sp. M20]QDH74370.1 hypothetical protein FKQ52_13645 [Brevundimonas sp. M20]